MPDVGDWLAALGLARYVNTFRENDVDLDTVRHLSDADLKEMGLPVGARRKILASLGSSAIAVRSGSRPSVQGAERRQLTVAFLDLVGSTELSQRFDPEPLRDLIGSYHAEVSREVERFEGYVAKLMGDGVLAYFGWPIAHENDAERAVRAGLAAISAVTHLRAPDNQPLSVRVGIATGLVVVGDLIGEGAAQEDAVVGAAPNLAARLQAIAQPNSLLVESSTHRLLGDRFRSGELGYHHLKGFSERVEIWRIEGEVARQDQASGGLRFSHGLVGRKAELDQLAQVWDGVRNGPGRLVLLSGEPGIGKTHLVESFLSGIDGPYKLLRFSCSPHHLSTPLYPVAREILYASGARAEDDAAKKLEKLTKFLGSGSPEADKALPFLADLLSIEIARRDRGTDVTPQAAKAGALKGLTAFLQGIAAEHPVLVVLEDAHWIDPTTREWLDLVAASLGSMRVLLILTARPEARAPECSAAGTTTITLDRLNKEEADALVAQLAEGAGLRPDVLSQIVSRTEGVPLFLEELTRAVIESHRGVLNGREPSIPATLHGSLMARLDRLGPGKALAQVAACIGRLFDPRLLIAVVEDKSSVERNLPRLESSGLFVRQGFGNDVSFSFKHALIQDAAYGSLLRSVRERTHGRIASVLEAQFPDIVESEPETLARHCTLGGRGELATGYWLKAGQKALKRSATAEAINHLSSGLELLGSMDKSAFRLRREIELRSARGVALMAAKGWGSPEVFHEFSTARKLSQDLGEAAQAFVALCGEASYHMISGSLPVSDELGRQCMELAEKSGQPDLLLEAHHRQWATKYFLGDYEEALSHAEFGLANYDPEHHHALTFKYTGHDPGVCCRMYSGLTLWYRGYPDKALDRCRDAVRLAEHLNHPLTLELAYFRLGTVGLLRGDAVEAVPRLEKALSLSEKFGFALPRWECRFQLGWARAMRGEVGPGLLEMNDAMQAIVATGARVALQEYLCILAGFHCPDDVGKGLALVDEALEIAARSTRHYLSEAHRLKGAFLLRQNDEQAAERHLMEALKVAREDAAKSLELRAAISIARLHRERGRTGDAWSLLATVLDWFSEGANTEDVRAGRALLKELAH